MRKCQRLRQLGKVALLDTVVAEERRAARDKGSLFLG
jgi:hypothetical protein